MESDGEYSSEHIQSEAMELSKKAMDVLLDTDRSVNDAVYASTLAILTASAYKTFMDNQHPEVGDRWLTLFLELTASYLRSEGHNISLSMMRKD